MMIEINWDDLVSLLTQSPECGPDSLGAAVTSLGRILKPSEDLIPVLLDPSGNLLGRNWHLDGPDVRLQQSWKVFLQRISYYSSFHFRPVPP